jgi:hypothetical protein
MSSGRIDDLLFNHALTSAHFIIMIIHRGLDTETINLSVSIPLIFTLYFSGFLVALLNFNEYFSRAEVDLIVL